MMKGMARGFLNGEIDTFNIKPQLQWFFLRVLDIIEGLHER